MARAQRKDVDYFPHECNHGRKMSIIEAKYGNDGYAVWFKLLEQLGKANNHYIDISDDTNLMFLSSVFKIKDEKTLQILNDLSKLGAINSFLFDNHKVIWSEKFVESIKDAYRQRSGVIFQYSDVLNEITQKNNQSTVGLTPTGPNLPQSIPKEEYSKVKKSKEEESMEKRKLKFASTLEPFLEKYGRDFLKDFYAYWTEPNKSGTKFKQELEKTWSLDRRLDTWAKNEKNFKKEKSSAQKEKDQPEKVFGRMTEEDIKTNLSGW